MAWRQDIDPHHEPHRVLIHKGELVDAARGGRVVPYKIYYPVAHELDHLPVVVWSHGLGGSRDGAAFLARYIASHGYVVVHVQHVGSDSSIWEGKPGHPWDVIRATKIPRQASLDRFADVPFLLDHLEGIAAENPDIGAHMNPEIMGMCGHSFGALTTQVMAGQPFPAQDGTLLDFYEDRFRAGILYSFVPIDHVIDKSPAEMFGPMRLPLFFMTGTADENPITGQGYEYRMKVYEEAGCPEKHLLILKDGDHMVFAGSRGKLESNPKRHTHEDIIKVASLAYWDAYLRGDEAAKEWLTDGGIVPYLDGEAEYEYKAA